MNAILDDLTPAQREAAIQSGPVLVIAGAGTGKTKTLTAAVAHRIADCGMPANRVLAVTFTNKAAAEMTGRIRMALGDGAAPHWTGTFHGLGARQLRIEPEVADLRPGFDILDADDTRRMIKRVMKSMNLASGDDEGGSIRDPLKLVCNRISKWKDELITPADAPAAAERMIAQANAGRFSVDPPSLRAAARGPNPTPETRKSRTTDSVSDRQVTASGKLDPPCDGRTPTVPGLRGARQPVSMIDVFWFGWGAVFSSRPEHCQATGVAAVKDGLVLSRPPRTCAARSVLEGGGARCEPPDSRAGRPWIKVPPNRISRFHLLLS
jgi:hypothetical protein